MEFSVQELWETMTPIAKGVMVVLIILSVYSIYIMVERLIYYRKARKQSLQFARTITQYLKQDKAAEAIELARKYKHSHLARVTRAGLIEFQLDAASGLSGHDVIESARRAIERETLIAQNDLKKGVGALATIATTSPFIGLFGTVIGIINAFRGMALTGSGGIGAVSAGIAEALVATALGLFVAIPAAWMFNQFTNTLERFAI